VLNRFREHNLKLKVEKCYFLQPETNYLGYFSSEKGTKPDPEKVKAIESMVAPACVREDRAFIGLCSYYRRILAGFSEIDEPVIALTRKFARFKWTNECQKSFQSLKDALTKIPYLTYPNINGDYII
jgi:hypothetical protein